MDWPTAAGLGAVGGGLAEAVVFFGYLTRWQGARHKALLAGRIPPPLSKYIDRLADGLVALTRLAMGAGAGLLFHAGVTGTYAAIAVGVSAPALLAQLGSVRPTQR